MRPTFEIGHSRRHGPKKDMFLRGRHQTYDWECISERPSGEILEASHEEFLAISSERFSGERFFAEEISGGISERKVSRGSSRNDNRRKTCRSSVKILERICWENPRAGGITEGRLAKFQKKLQKNTRFYWRKKFETEFIDKNQK